MSFKHLLFCVAMMGCTTLELGESGRELTELEAEAPSPEPVPAPAPAPAPGPNGPKVGDRCDNIFSIPACRGGNAGVTVCTLPDNTKGVCWSGGPQFLNGSWDCQFCDPTRQPPPPPPPVVIDAQAP